MTTTFSLSGGRSVPGCRGSRPRSDGGLGLSKLMLHKERRLKSCSPDHFANDSKTRVPPRSMGRIAGDHGTNRTRPVVCITAAPSGSPTRQFNFCPAQAQSQCSPLNGARSPSSDIGLEKGGSHRPSADTAAGQIQSSTAHNIKCEWFLNFHCPQSGGLPLQLNR